MTETPSLAHYILLDSNALVSERLLLSALGSAMLHSAAKHTVTILLPEIVERETTVVLLRLANEAAEDMHKAADLISQLANHPQAIIVPSQEAIAQALSERWNAISGIVERVPFTFEQARFALDRILAKLPPCGPNNEQFRDCCIWDVALSKASEAPVHLITSDKAFYRGGTHLNGMATNLQHDMAGGAHPITLHPTISDYLRSIGDEDKGLDEGKVAELIEEQLSPEAEAIANNGGRSGSLSVEFETITLTGFSTPKPSAIAVSFDAKYKVTATDEGAETTRDTRFSMRVVGNCSYDPSIQKVSDIVILEWSKNLFTEGGGSASTYSPSARMRRMFTEGNFRILKSGF